MSMTKDTARGVMAASVAPALRASASALSISASAAARSGSLVASSVQPVLSSRIALPLSSRITLPQPARRRSISSTGERAPVPRLFSRGVKRGKGMTGTGMTVIMSACCMVLLALILALASCPQAALALGISPLRSSAPFVPGGEVSGSFSLINQEGFESVLVYVESDMDVLFDQKTVRLDGNDGIIAFTIELPQARPSPGDHEVKIFVQPGDGMGEEGMSARVRLAHKLTIRVPREGPYVTASLKTGRSAAGEVLLTADLENIGDKGTQVSALFIMTPSGAKDQILNASLGPESLDAGESAQVNVTLPGTRIPAGDYTVDLFVTYAGRAINTSAAYRKGEPRFALTQTPTFVKAEELNTFPVGVHSEWNHPIEGLYAEILLTDNNETLRLFRTESVDVPALGDAVLSGIFDGRGITPRNATVTVRLYFSQTQEFRVPIEIVDKNDYEWLMVEAERTRNATARPALPVAPALEAAASQEDVRPLWLVSLLILAVFVLITIIARRIVRGDER